MIKIKVGYSGTRLISRPSPNTFRFEYEYLLRLKVSSTSTQKSCTRVRVQYSSTSSLAPEPWNLKYFRGAGRIGNSTLIGYIVQAVLFGRTTRSAM